MIGPANSHNVLFRKIKKGKKNLSNAEVFIFIQRLNYAFASTDTKDLLFAFFLKTTLPSTKANKV